MTADQYHRSDPDQHFSEVLVDCLEALDRGQIHDPQELLTRHPEFAGELTKFLADQAQVDRWTAPLRQMARGVSSPFPESAAIPQSAEQGFLGDYRILREIGRGGMGVVYEAEQISLGRRVALKVLPFAAAMDSKRLQRFKNEAQAAAQLHHTNIVPVFGVGCERAVHFYAMQFIEGQTLAAVIHELRRTEKKDEVSGRGAEDALADPNATGSAPTSPIAAISTEHSIKEPAFFRTVAKLGVQAAEALEHAHQLGVVHRDIKPANLLIDVQGNLWITDFGLAQFKSEAGLTLTGDLVGTLRYMSPEQALAKRIPIDHRTDIYSLGVTLYELLTLEPAVRGRDRQELLRQIAFEEPTQPRKINKAIPAELETIVLKAMGKNPEERYDTAQEMADDLERFLADKPIRAKRPSALQRLRKWTRRHQVAVRAAVGSAIVVLGIAVVLLTGGYWQLQEQVKEKEKAYFREVEAKKELEWELVDREVHLADLQSKVKTAGGLLEFAAGYVNTAAQAPRGRETLVLGGHVRPCMGVAYSPDGRFLAATSDRKLTIYEADTGKEVHVFRGSVRFFQVAFSPDSRLITATSDDNHVHLWDWLTRQELPRLPTSSRGSLIGYPKVAGWSVAFSADGAYLASVGWGGTVHVWDMPEAKRVRRLEKGYIAAAFSPDGRLVASAVHQQGQVIISAVTIWDAATGTEKFTLQKHGRSVTSLAFSPNGRYIASSGYDPYVKIGDLQTRKQRRILEGHTAPVPAVRYSPDGHFVASASLDGTVKIWDASEGRLLTTLDHGTPVVSLAFNTAGTRLASGGGYWSDADGPGVADETRLPKRGQVKIWDKRLWEKK